MDIMLILCQASELDPLLEKVEDWKSEGAQTFLYGITAKAQHGFLFLEWGNPAPPNVHHQLINNDAVLDYFTFSNIVVRPRKDTPTERKDV